MDRAIIGLRKGTDFRQGAIECDRSEQDGQSGNLWTVARYVAVLWLKLFAKESFLVLILCFVSKDSVTLEFFEILLQGAS
jgi:hypothetical protein